MEAGSGQKRRWIGAVAAALLSLGCAGPGEPPAASVSAEPVLAAPGAVLASPAPPSALPPPAAQAAVPAPAPEPPIPSLAARVAEAKGWGWLVDRLAAGGVPRERAARSFADPRMPAFEGLFFAVEPREPRSMYGAVLRPRSIAAARACAAEHAPAFQAAERASGVPGELVAAILHVETRCGRNTGRSSVLFGLARLAMANEPENVAANIARRAREASRVPDLAERVRGRAARLEEMFLPEVRAVFALADAEGVDPLDLRGSRAGAFGAAQFLPTSYQRFGVDGNGDGRIDLHDIDDAAASAAHFLASHGWKDGLSPAERRQVVWHYNRSAAYIDAVLRLSDRLRGSVRSYYVHSPAGAVPVEAAQ